MYLSEFCDVKYEEKHTAAVGCNQTKKNHPVRSCMCYNALNNGIYVPLHRELNSPASIHTKG